MSHILTRRIGMTSALRVQRVRRTTLKDSLFLLHLSLAIFLFILLAAFYLWIRLEIIELGYEISRANRIRHELTEENKRLKIELTNLKSPERIEGIGRRLGLHYPSGGEVIRVR